MSQSKIVDVSNYQSADLSGLTADPSVRGVVVKFSEGTSTASGSLAHSQAATAAGAGLLVLGGYDFARPGDGGAEARVLAEAVRGTPVHVLCIDAEVPGIDGVHVVSFAQGVAAEGYGRALLYGSTSYIASSYGGNMAVKQWTDLWVAEYHRCFCVDVYPICPDPFNEYVGWQFTDREPVLGGVDCSVFDDNYLGGAYAHSLTNPNNIGDEMATGVLMTPDPAQGDPTYFYNGQDKPRIVRAGEPDILAGLGLVPSAKPRVVDPNWIAILTAETAQPA